MMVMTVWYMAIVALGLAAVLFMINRKGGRDA